MKKEKKLEEGVDVVTDYHMNYRLTRTSMSLDEWTLRILGELAQKWDVSKAEVLRRAVRKVKEEADREDAFPKPLEALDWLQNGGGLTLQESNDFREEVQAERQAKRFWWER
jgi:Arc/MetJ-type ribon-helix-helix transcriptional regulator